MDTTLVVTKLHNDTIMLFNYDCFDVLKHLKPNTVSMVFADLPYGSTANDWDQCVDLSMLWFLLHKVSMPTTVYVFTAQMPFTVHLGASNIAELRYSYAWNKVVKTNHLQANKQPLRQHEDILVFYQKQGCYNPQKQQGKPHSSHTGNSTENYGSFARVKPHKLETTYYPTSVITFSNKAQHKVLTTQKPLELLEFLIKTYTNPGDLVLDPTMGSGTTALACKRLGRRCIGIEKDKLRFNTSVQRVIDE